MMSGNVLKDRVAIRWVMKEGVGMSDKSISDSRKGMCGDTEMLRHGLSSHNQAVNFGKD